MDPAIRPPLSRTIWALGWVSLFTDISGDMVFTQLPRFLRGLSDAGEAAVGIVEGIADAISHLAKPWAGKLSDRGPRKPWVLAGYSISGVARPALAAAGSVLAVGVIRSVDRVGRGLRSAPRDALIAAAAPPGGLARAFSVQRGMDHAGAVIGPLLASALLWYGLTLRQLFLVAAIPGVLALVTIAIFVREEPPRPDAAKPASDEPLPRRLTLFLWVAFAFALGTSTDALLLLRAEEMGVPVTVVPVLWTLLHVVKMASSYPGGALADRVGPVRVLGAGWIVYAVIYAGFAFAAGATAAWVLFLAYGLYYGLTESAEKAIVASLAPAGAKGRALGLFALALGAGTLVASVTAGALYRWSGPEWGFGFSAIVALGATVLLAMWARRR